MIVLDETGIETYKTKYEINQNGCWVWKGKTTIFGYARTKVHGKQITAHRLFYQTFKGPIPTGLVIDHLCRTRNCLNPDHLEAVTQKENVRRGLSTGKRTFTTKRTSTTLKPKPQQSKPRLKRPWARTGFCMNGHDLSIPSNFKLVERGKRCRICLNEYSKLYKRKRRLQR